MDWLNIRKRAVLLAKEYRYVALVLAIGLVLILLPENETEKTEPEIPETEPVMLYETSLEQELTALLQQMEGVGRVSVLLTEAQGEQILYQTDQDSTRASTVILTDSERDQQGLVMQIIPPSYLGAVILCQGADSPTVRLGVVEAVSKATGLSSEKIVVLKMK